MEISKQRAIYVISDTTDDNWVISGTATKEQSDDVYISFSINSDSTNLGTYNYSFTGGRISETVSALQANNSAIKTYCEEAFTKIQEYLNNTTVAD